MSNESGNEMKSEMKSEVKFKVRCKWNWNEMKIKLNSNLKSNESGSELEYIIWHWISLHFNFTFKSRDLTRSREISRDLTRSRDLKVKLKWSEIQCQMKVEMKWKVKWKVKSNLKSDASGIEMKWKSSQIESQMQVELKWNEKWNEIELKSQDLEISCKISVESQFVFTRFCEISRDLVYNVEGWYDLLLWKIGFWALTNECLYGFCWNLSHR